jgi:tripartite-type tricarboxylate transporter receptor subunit TctC
MNARSALSALTVVAALGTPLVSASPVEAQSYPSRPITMIAPFAAGGPTDTMARIMADRMRISLRQPVIVENVVGAGGSLGVGRVARANPDGYTIAIGNWGTHVANGAMYSLSYDLVADFEPVAILPHEPLLIVANKAAPAQDLKGLISWLRAHPDKVSMATSGVGGPSHIAGLLFQQLTGARFQLVPYRGAAPAMQDVVAGQLDLMIAGPSVALPFVRSGMVNAFAVASTNRLATAPEIPSVDEVGLPGFHLSVWQGLWAPRGTSKDIIGKLNTAARDAMADNAVRQRFADLGLEPPPLEQQSPEALAAYQQAEINKWWPIIKAANIKAQ